MTQLGPLQPLDINQPPKSGELETLEGVTLLLEGDFPPPMPKDGGFPSLPTSPDQPRLFRQEVSNINPGKLCSWQAGGGGSTLLP